MCIQKELKEATSSSKEIWKPVEGYEGLYEVSNLGNVRSMNYSNTGIVKTLKPSRLRNGYLVVGLCKDGGMKSVKVHRLVAGAFLDNTNNFPCVNHKNENKEDNRLDNLEWCTHKYNCNYGSRIERTQSTRNNRGSYGACKPVIQLSLSGDFIAEFKSICEAERQTGIHNRKICSCCRHSKGQKTAGGYIWKYKS